MPAIDLLINGAERLGIKLDAQAIKDFQLFTGRLLTVNQVMNLTAITEPDEVMIKHHLDSLTPLLTGMIPFGAKLIDVGCGAGFPGMPLKIARNDIKLTLLDSLNKRISFLQETSGLLIYDNVKCIHSRAEEAGVKPEYREKYDVAISRALASLSVLAEYCLPFVKVGGVFIAMKGPSPQSEIDEAQNAIQILGGRIKDIMNVNLPGTDITHTLVVILKTMPTPKIYPRTAAKMQKAPL